MSELTKAQRAFQAFLVSSLRNAVPPDLGPAAEDDVDREVDRLLGDDLVDRLLAGELARSEDPAAFADDTSAAGLVLYRTDGVDDETAAELDADARAAIERERERRRSGENRENGQPDDDDERPPKV